MKVKNFMIKIKKNQTEYLIARDLKEAEDLAYSLWKDKVEWIMEIPRR